MQARLALCQRRAPRLGCRAAPAAARRHAAVAPRARRPRAAAAAGGGDAGADDPAPPPAYRPPPRPAYERGATALPLSAPPPAGAVFFLAGFLKILILCFPFSSMAVAMYVQGRADLGFAAAAKMIPLALGLAAAAKAIIDRGLLARRWAPAAVAAAGLAMLVASRWAFCRPRPSPLDAPIAAYRAARAAEAASEAQAARALRARRAPPGAGGAAAEGAGRTSGGRSMPQPSAAARAELEARARRFS